MPKIIAAALITLLLSATFYSAAMPVAACSCIFRETSERVENSDLVFIGEITGFDDPVNSQFVPLPEQTTILKVERYLKGTGGPEQRVTDPAGGGASCGYFPRTSDAIGQRHLAFAFVDSGTVRTSLCSGNISFAGQQEPIAEVAAVEAITGPGTAPVQETSPQEESPSDDKDTPWAVVLPLAFAIPLAVLFLPAFLRRRTPGGH